MTATTATQKSDFSNTKAEAAAHAIDALRKELHLCEEATARREKLLSIYPLDSKELERAIQDAVRLPAVRTALKVAEEHLTWVQGQERLRFVNSIKEEFDQAYAVYTAASKALLEQFRNLQRLNNQYLSMTQRPLLAPHDVEMNLPAITGSLAARSNFSTGQDGGPPPAWS